MSGVIIKVAEGDELTVEGLDPIGFCSNPAAILCQPDMTEIKMIIIFKWLKKKKTTAQNLNLKSIITNRDARSGDVGWITHQEECGLYIAMRSDFSRDIEVWIFMRNGPVSRSTQGTTKCT